MPQRYVEVSFDGLPEGGGALERADAIYDITNNNEAAGGLGWEPGFLANDPITIYRVASDDGEFEAALAKLRDRVGGEQYANEVRPPED